MRLAGLCRGERSIGETEHHARDPDEIAGIDVCLGDGFAIDVGTATAVQVHQRALAVWLGAQLRVVARCAEVFDDDVVVGSAAYPHGDGLGAWFRELGVYVPGS